MIATHDAPERVGHPMTFLLTAQVWIAAAAAGALPLRLWGLTATDVASFGHFPDPALHRTASAFLLVGAPPVA